MMTAQEIKEARKAQYRFGWQMQRDGSKGLVPWLAPAERDGYAARMWAMRRPVAERVAQSAARDARVVEGV